jgi:hypothetical protein
MVQGTEKPRAGVIKVKELGRAVEPNPDLKEVRCPSNAGCPSVAFIIHLELK